MFVNALIIYYIIAVFYFVILFCFKRKIIITQLLILFTFPFIGMIIAMLMLKEEAFQGGSLPEWLVKREVYDDVSIEPSDYEADRNIIPFEEALLLNNNHIKRKMLIDMLKGDFSRNIDSLEDALKNEDSETSHYAATAIQSIKRDLLKQMYEMEELLTEESDDIYALNSYRDILKDYIRIEFLDKKTRYKYMNYYTQTLAKIIENDPSYQLDNLIEKINTDLELNLFDQAIQTVKILIEKYPTSEEAYFAALKVHFYMKNKKEFENIFNMMKESKTILSPNKLNQLRFWLQGGY